MRSVIGALLLAAGVVSSGAAQSPGSVLEFLGLRPGMPESEMKAVIGDLGGTFRCSATTEPRLRACSGTIPDPDAGVLSVTASMVDGEVGVALVSATLAPTRVGDWHAALTDRYGDAPVQRRPGQERFQWILDRRMLRLTVRREAASLTASVSLVDGRLLDSLPAP
jgi:hypothetical protein